MAFVFFGDLLGTKSLIENNNPLAEPVLRQFANRAMIARNQVMGKPKTSTRALSVELAILSDSVIMQAPTLPQVIRFATVLAQSLILIHEPDGGPVAIRGGIGRLETPLRERFEKSAGTRVSQVFFGSSKDAIVGEMRGVRGSRILLPRKLLDDEQYWKFSPSIQAKLTSFAELGVSTRTGILGSSTPVGDYCDILWMNDDSTQRFDRVKSAVLRFLYGCAPDLDAMPHAAATGTLLRATELRRRGLTVILRRLASGLLKGDPKPPKADYEGWLKRAPLIAARRREQGKDFRFPLEFTAGITQLLKKDRFAKQV